MDGKDIRIKHLQEKPAMTDVRNIVTHVLENGFTGTGVKTLRPV